MGHTDHRCKIAESVPLQSLHGRRKKSAGEEGDIPFAALNVILQRVAAKTGLTKVHPHWVPAPADLGATRANTRQIDAVTETRCWAGPSAAPWRAAPRVLMGRRNFATPLRAPSVVQ